MSTLRIYCEQCEQSEVAHELIHGTYSPAEQEWGFFIHHMKDLIFYKSNYKNKIRLICNGWERQTLARNELQDEIALEHKRPDMLQLKGCIFSGVMDLTHLAISLPTNSSSYLSVGSSAFTYAFLLIFDITLFSLIPTIFPIPIFIFLQLLVRLSSKRVNDSLKQMAQWKWLWRLDVVVHTDNPRIQEAGAGGFPLQFKGSLD